jgi:hypothetical protein
LRRAPFYNVVNEQGAGSFYTTPTDLLAFCRALPLEPPDAAAAAPPVSAEGEWRPPASIGHNGLGNGFASYCYRFPEQDACLVMLANIETGLFGRLDDDLTHMLFDQPVSPPPAGPPAVPFDPAAAALVVGDYDFLPGAPLTVRATSEGLELSAGGGFHPLIPIDDDRYFLRLKFAEVAFRPGGPDPSLQWSQDGQTYTLRRIGTA